MSFEPLIPFGMAALCMIALFLVLRSTKNKTSDAPQMPALELSEEDRVRDVGDRSDLMPVGWVMILTGSLVAIWAWFFMDVAISTSYGDTVNIDAVSQRAMLHTAALVTVAIGAVLACAGHVINEIRRQSERTW